MEGLDARAAGKAVAICALYRTYPPCALQASSQSNAHMPLPETRILSRAWAALGGGFSVCELFVLVCGGYHDYYIHNHLKIVREIVFFVRFNRIGIIE